MTSTYLTARIPFLDINQKRNHAYAGYIGILEVARELYAAFYNPVWEQVYQLAPWSALEVENSPKENI
ncbi:hypothetical protein [Nostoc favosum]|uniref:hypothetical protein n=1 Tax=Nostoc favosum TaxID=2907819 RepID=UPI003F68B130